GRLKRGAAAFRFKLDDDGVRPRLIEAGVGMRCAVLRLPYGDQGLLVPADLYREIGGYKGVPLLEDIDIVRRLGYRRVRILRTGAVTSARRYRSDGYTVRVLRNWACVVMYGAGVPMRYIVRFYD
ncbi:MAG TPA: glycosyl transferase family 2, partial [Hyphomicrobiaceae bacterium]|nr:glycosyl transferase family 2 [Hyphomicrobiaceae bacterium]